MENIKKIMISKEIDRLDKEVKLNESEAGEIFEALARTNERSLRFLKSLLCN